jgi:hypothetical protein
MPAWIVFDADFRRKYPIGPLMPGEAVPDERLRKSWLGNTVYWKDDTLAGLAAQIGVDAAGLRPAWRDERLRAHRQGPAVRARRQRLRPLLR